MVHRRLYIAIADTAAAVHPLTRASLSHVFATRDYIVLTAVDRVFAHLQRSYKFVQFTRAILLQR